MTTSRLAEMTHSQLQTREQHLLVRADASGTPSADHSHSRQLREVRAEIARRPCCSLVRAGHADACRERAAYLRSYQRAAGE